MSYHLRMVFYVLDGTSDGVQPISPPMDVYNQVGGPGFFIFGTNYNNVLPQKVKHHSS